MAGTRLSDDEAGALARRILLKTFDCEQAVLALERASGIIRAQGLSAPVVDRLLSSNERAAELTLQVLEHGIVGLEAARYDSIQAAIKEVGTQGVCYASLAANMVDFALILIKEANLDNPEFVAPSLACAETAYWLSEKHIIDPMDAFTRALFADVGLFAMVYALPEVYKALALSDTKESLVAFEQASLSIDHQQIGARLLNELKFPEPVVSFAAKHHNNSFELNLEEKMVKVAYVTIEAESDAAGLSTAVEGLSTSILDAALLKDSDISELMSVAGGFLIRATQITSLDLPEAA